MRSSSKGAPCIRCVSVVVRSVVGPRALRVSADPPHKRVDSQDAFVVGPGDRISGNSASASETVGTQLPGDGPVRNCLPK